MRRRGPARRRYQPPGQRYHLGSSRRQPCSRRSRSFRRRPPQRFPQFPRFQHCRPSQRSLRCSHTPASTWQAGRGETRVGATPRIAAFPAPAVAGSPTCWALASAQDSTAHSGGRWYDRARQCGRSGTTTSLCYGDHVVAGRDFSAKARDDSRGIADLRVGVAVNWRLGVAHGGRLYNGSRERAAPVHEEASCDGPPLWPGYRRRRARGRAASCAMNRRGAVSTGLAQRVT